MKERWTKRTIVVFVPNREAATLVAVIEKYVAPGAYVFTDMYPSYFCLGVVVFDIGW